MILVDTSVWADHIRKRNEIMARLMGDGKVLIHPFVVGELVLGNLNNRAVYIASWEAMPHAQLAQDAEVFKMIELNTLYGTGIGYVDAHLLASARISQVKLWTRDKRLHSVAAKLGLAEAY